MDSPLNSAHRYRRKAEQDLKSGRYDDAIQSHKECERYLNEAINESTIPKNIECLQQQREYHQYMQRIIRRKKSEFESYMAQNQLGAKKEPEIRESIATTLKESTPETSNDVKIVKNILDFDNMRSTKSFSLVDELKTNDDPFTTVLKVTTIDISDDSDSD